MIPPPPLSIHVNYPPNYPYSLTVPGAPSASPQTHYIFMYLKLALFSYVLP